MADHHERTDQKTESDIREALAMKTAFGDNSAREFLKRRGIAPELVERVITARRQQLRY